MRAMSESHSIFGYLVANPSIAAAIGILALVIAYLAFFLPKTKNPKELHEVEVEPDELRKPREIPARLVSVLDRLNLPPWAREAEISAWSRKYAEVADALASEGGEAKKVAELLKADSFEKAAESLDWMIKGDRSRIADRYWTRGRVLELMLDKDGAAQMFREAHSLEPENHVYATSLAAMLSSLGRTAEACAINESFLPKLRKLAQFNPDSYLADFAETVEGLAEFTRAAGRMAEADALWFESVDARRVLAKKDEAKLPRLADALDGLARFLVGARNVKKAAEVLREAIELRKKLMAADPATTRPRLAAALNSLGAALLDLGELSDAEGAVLDALDIRRELAEENEMLYGPSLSATLVTLGNVYKAFGRTAEAEAVYRDAASRYSELAKVNPVAFLPAVAAVRNNLGILYNESNRPSDAERSFKKALEAAEADPDKESTQKIAFTATALNNLGNLYRSAQRPRDAEAHYAKALELRRKLARRDANPFLHEVAATLNNLGSLYMGERKFAEAEKLFREALEIYKRYALMSPEAFGPFVKIVERNLEGMPNRH